MEFSSDIFTVEEAARYLKIPVSSIYKLAQEGRIPAQKVGRHWRFHRNTLDQWIAGGSQFEFGSGKDSNKGMDFS
ncbi:MAG: helix-turn-helix domain-containing protein [Anaerolineaceae bacterium]|nr:helix-turn-helix domain-containing protein [Anaerolineaceae bacterium]